VAPFWGPKKPEPTLLTKSLFEDEADAVDMKWTEDSHAAHISRPTASKHDTLLPQPLSTTFSRPFIFHAPSAHTDGRVTMTTRRLICPPWQRGKVLPAVWMTFSAKKRTCCAHVYGKRMRSRYKVCGTRSVVEKSMASSISGAPITSPMHSSVYIGCVYRSESNSRSPC